jgi:hypothetical protein
MVAVVGGEGEGGVALNRPLVQQQLFRTRGYAFHMMDVRRWRHGALPREE